MSKETHQYDNCLDISTSTLLDHLDLTDEEKSQFERSDEKEWKKLWKGMPEYDQENNPPYKQLIVSFRSQEDYDKFAKLIDQNLTFKTKSIWHPRLDKEANSLLRWIEE